MAGCPSGPSATFAVARYFVTGATGFIGGQLVRQLLRSGHEVVVLARTPAKAQDLQELGADVRQGDITDPASMRAPMAGVDGVFHVAGWYQVGVRDKSPAQAINVDGTRNVLELMRELGVPRGVYTSSLAVFGDTHGRVVDESYFHQGPWHSEYDRTKWVAHYQIAEPLMRDGLPLVIVQPGAVYGSDDISPTGQVLRDFLRRKLLAIPRGAAHCWAHVADTVHGHILAMERGRVGESYIIAGSPHTLADVLRIATRVTGIPGPRLLVPPAVLKGLARAAGVIERVVPVPPTYSSEYLRVAAGATYLGSNAKARRELGFEVRPLEEGLRETLAYEMERLGLRRPSPGP